MLHDLKIRPGFVTVPTDRAAAGRWKDGDKVRFHNGLPQKVGGWLKSTTNTYLGYCRGTIDWPTLALEHFIGAGTHLKLYVYKGGTFYDITPYRSTGTLALDPFAMTIGSAVVTVTHIAHGCLVGDYVHYSGAAAAQGITVDGEYAVTSLVDADHYTITHSAPATGTGSGGGAAVAFSYEIHIGVGSSIYGYGWGSGSWGSGTWGTARTISNFLAKARTWKLDTWGEDLVACYRTGGIYLWDASVGVATRAALIGAAPATARGIFVSPENRILVAYGAHSGSADDPMLVRWSDGENYNQWTPDVLTNVAGSKRLDKGTELLAHAKTRIGVLLHSDSFAWLVTFDGPPYTFGFTPVGPNGYLVGPNACAAAPNGAVFWMGKQDFFIYDGSIHVLECPVHNHVFDSFNFVQKDKVFAGINLTYSEVWWLYPSASATECDRYVIYNYKDNLWYFGTLDRTAFVGDSVVFDNAYGFGTDGYLYDHEYGVDADGGAMRSYIESGDVELGEGEWIMKIRKMIPDFKILTGNIALTMKGRKYPQGEQRTKGPVTMTSATKYVNPRIRARQIAIYLESNAVGANWRAGTFRLELTQSGKR